MPVSQIDDYKPNVFLRNGHINTFYAYLTRTKPNPQFQRERMFTSDGDFVDLDMLSQGSKKLVVLCHGLEGSSNSQYMRGTSDLLFKNGWDVIAINHRGCSGEPNLRVITYHSGFTRDLNEVIEKYGNDYKEISIVGFSLGGNIVLKYAGDMSGDLHEKIQHCVAVSVPCHLAEGAQEIISRKNAIYHNNFLKSLIKKARAKHKLFPDIVNIKSIEKCKTLIEFDNEFTAPIHGFVDAWDYYQKSSSIFKIKNIRRKSMIINALDDPFLPEECYPYEEAKNNPLVHLLTPKYGGHIGFTLSGNEYFWEELKILDFLSNKPF